MNVREMTDEGLAGAILAGLVAEPVDQGRMDELQAESKRRHAGCCCDDPVDGPVPNYCPIHDGDYSSWLAWNNID